MNVQIDTQAERRAAKTAYDREYRAANAERLREYRAANAARAAARQREYRERNPIEVILRAARNRAKRAGMDFNISREDVVIPERCPILGITLAKVPGNPDTRGSSPSLDRVDNSKGYVKGNVMVISFRANEIKADATPSELRAFAAFYGREL